METIALGSFVDINGSLLPADQPLFNSSNRAFRYGDGVFETLLLFEGRLPWFEHHLIRMNKGLEVLKINLNCSASEIKNRILALAAAQKTSTGRVRISVFRTGEGTYFPITNVGDVVIELLPMDASTVFSPVDRIMIHIYKDHFKNMDHFSNLKTCNALIYVLAGLWAKNNGYHEACILNTKGMLCESVSSNVFLIKKSKLITPSLSEGCIEGVCRKMAIQTAKERGFAVEERAVSISELMEADECFLTNSIGGVQSVTGISSKRFYKKIGMQLQRELRQTL
jgi:branched-chain amino acid aminotransferase